MSDRSPVTALVALGANLGHAPKTVRQALVDLGRMPATRVESTSFLYRSAPYEAQGPDFINAVARIATGLTAPDLLVALQALEAAAGRERPYLNAPRTLDLDLIYYGQACVDSPALTVPHPRWQERAFVLLPLAEVAPERVTPEMLASVAGQLIERLDEPGRRERNLSQ
jgi:2-amino-4-hydroxy-6-hydroxymethyldihydropteridine diphosphokinase